jgi:hypothetical protein
MEWLVMVATIVAVVVGVVFVASLWFGGCCAWLLFLCVPLGKLSGSGFSQAGPSLSFRSLDHPLLPSAALLLILIVHSLQSAAKLLI